MSLLMVRKSAPAHAAINEFNRLVNSAKDAADAVDAAAQFKVGDKIWVDPSYGANLNIGYGWNVGIVKRVGTGNIDVDFKGQVISVPAPYCARVNSSGKPVFDSAAIDELKGVIGIIHNVASVNEFNRLVDSAKDAAESINSNAEAIVNHDRIPVDQLGGEANARKNGYIIAKKGGRVYGVHIDGYSDKLAKKTIEEAGYTVVGDADELNNYADLRAALSKMADIAKRLTDAKVSFKAGWTPDGIGEIILEFPNIEIARKYNYYKLFNAWEAARRQIVPSWAVNIGGYSIPRIEGNRMTIGISHFST